MRFFGVCLIAVSVLACSIPAAAQVPDASGHTTVGIMCPDGSGNYVYFAGATSCPEVSSPSDETSTDSSDASSDAASSAGAALGHLGATIMIAFIKWIFSPPAGDSGPSAAEVREAFLNRLVSEREAAQEQSRTQDVARLDALFARINSVLKLNGLPDIHYKSGEAHVELALKVGNCTAYGIPGLPGTYTGGARSSPDAAQPSSCGTAASPPQQANSSACTGYGIPGLPGTYTNGPRSEASPAPSSAGCGGAPETTACNGYGIRGLPGTYTNGAQGQSCTASAAPGTTTAYGIPGLPGANIDGPRVNPSPAAPDSGGLHLKLDGAQSAAAPRATRGMTVQQAADSFASLPPLEQQRLLDLVAHDAHAAQGAQHRLVRVATGTQDAVQDAQTLTTATQTSTQQRPAGLQLSEPSDTQYLLPRSTDAVPRSSDPAWLFPEPNGLQVARNSDMALLFPANASLTPVQRSELQAFRPDISDDLLEQDLRTVSPAAADRFHRDPAYVRRVRAEMSAAGQSISEDERSRQRDIRRAELQDMNRELTQLQSLGVIRPGIPLEQQDRDPAVHRALESARARVRQRQAQAEAHLREHVEAAYDQILRRIATEGSTAP